MRSFVCIVLLAAAALAAPSQRDKRGYLSSGYVDHDVYSDVHSHDYISHGSLGLSSYSLGHGYGIGHSDYSHGYIAPAHRIVSYDKVVSVPKVVEVKRVVSVPKVVSIPKVVSVSKIVEEPHHISYDSYGSHGSYGSQGSYGSHGWW